MSDVTKHAQKRIRERCGLPKKAVQRMADKALVEGVRHKDTVGALHKWVDGLFLQARNGNNIRLYGNHAFIFHDEILITVINIPPRFVEKEYVRK